VISKKNFPFLIILLVLLLLGGCGSRSGQPLTAEQAAAGYHFDDGTLQGWEPRGEASISVSRKTG
jgi:hypothetical protein